MIDRQLDDGSVMRIDPRTGKSRTISQSDYARTQLTRERDNQLAMQAGAPPIARGAPPTLPESAPGDYQGRVGLATESRYRTPDRALNVARAKADGQFDSIRANFNATSKGTQMDEAGTISPATPAAPAPTLPQPEAAFDKPMRNIAVAAGPNISTAPTGMPEGSIGYARKAGGYTVRAADGSTQDFASETAAKAAFAAPSAAKIPSVSAPAPAAPFVAPKAPRQDAAPDAASQAWADNSSGRFAAQDSARAPAALSQPSPELQAVVAAATQPPQPAPTPANTPATRDIAKIDSDIPLAPNALKMVREKAVQAQADIPSFASAETSGEENQARFLDNLGGLLRPFTTERISQPGGKTQDLDPTQPGRSAEAPENLRARAAKFPEGSPSRRALEARAQAIEETMRSNRAKPIDVPSVNRDAGSVAPAFDDGEPDAFPILSGPAGSSRPRASFA